MVVYKSKSDAPCLVSCDWFALSVRLARPRDGQPLVAPCGWSCVLMTPTAVWAERWFVMDADGNKVATILCVPRSRIIDPCRAVVEVANRWLYMDNFRDVVDAIASILPMSFEGLNRVDLCCDFEMDLPRWRTYSCLADGSAYVKALRSGSVWWQNVSASSECSNADVSRVPHCLTFGGKESTFKWKVYYKSLELMQAEPEAKKPYIVDMWRLAGLDEKIVWRCEVSVSGTNSVCRLDGRKVLPMEWYDDRVSLFCDLYADKFVVRRADGHKDKRNDRALPFLDLDGSRSICFAAPASSRDDSDPERRLTCKIWHELQQVDVYTNATLNMMLTENLRELVERPANMYVLRQVYGVTEADVEAVLTRFC